MKITTLLRILLYGLWLTMTGCEGDANDIEAVTQDSIAAEDDSEVDDKLDELENILKNKTPKTVVTTTESGTSGDVGNSAISFFPSTTDFGDISIGSSSVNQQVTVYNSSKYDIFLGSIAVGDTTHFTIVTNTCPTGATPVKSKASCVVTMKYTPTSGGVTRTQLTTKYGIAVATNTTFTVNSDLTGSGVSSLVFAGANSLSNIGGTSLQVNWTHVVGAITYYIYQVNGATLTLKGTVAAPTANYTVTGLTTNTSYTFRVRAADSLGISDANTTDRTTTTLANPPPTITSVSPTAGPLAGSTTITINGTGILAGVTATVGGTACTSPTYVSATQMTCVTPAKTAGSYDVVITNTDTQSASSASAFTYQAAPTVSSISPSSGSWSGGESVSITGSGYVTGATVTIGGQTCTSPSVSSATTITCTTGAYTSATQGTASDVVVTNADTQSGTLSSGYTYKFTRYDRLAGATQPRGCRIGSSSDSLYYDPRGMASDGTYLYLMDYSGHTIRKVEISTGASTNFAGQLCISGNVDGTGTATRVINPYGGVVLSGYLYFTQFAHHTVRRVNLTTGVLETVAGAYNSAGTTNATGTSAKFRNPRGIDTDGTYLYVVDQGNHRVRRIDPGTNAVTTFAGSSSGSTDATGTSAKFKSPRGITHVGGYLYVTETGNDRVRRIQISNQAVTTFAGSTAGHTDATGTSARFNDPYGITSDGTNLYVADRQVIRKIVIATAAVTTLAGTYNTAQILNDTGSAARFYNPYDVTYDNGYVYVTDDSKIIRRINTTTAAVTTFSGNYQTPRYLGRVNATGAAARFNNPYGVAVNGGDIYVADYSNHAIRKVTTAGVVTTFTGVMGSAGTTDATGTAARHNGPVGIDSYSNYLYITSYGKHTIRRINVNTQEVVTIAGIAGTTGNTNHATGTSATFFNPYGLAVDGTGAFLYVADYNNDEIRKVNLSTSEVTLLAGSTRGSVDGTGAAAQFNRPRYVEVQGNYLYVTSEGDHKLRRVNLTTQVVDTLTSTTAGYADNATTSLARLRGPRGLASDGTYLYIGEYNNHSVRAYNFSTGAVTTVTANLQPEASTTSSNQPLFEISGLLSADAVATYPLGVAYGSSTGIIVSTPQSIFRLH